MIRVGVASPSFSANEVLRRELDSCFQNVRYNDTKGTLNQSEIKEFLKDSDAAILGLESLDEDLVSSCPNLRVVSKYGVGLNNIDFKAAHDAKISVYSMPGVNKRSVSELVMSFMLGISRNVFNSIHQLKGGTWYKNGGQELTGKTVGIIGYGNVGADLATLLQPFAVNILVNDIVDVSPKFRDGSIKQVTKMELCRDADMISIHVPLDESTRQLVARNELDVMKSDAIIINTSRGGVVNEFDLLEKLLSSNIRAGLDVFEIEPQVGTVLLQHERVYPTPHIGGNSKEAVLAMGRAAIFNLKRHYGIL